MTKFYLKYKNLLFALSFLIVLVCLDMLNILTIFVSEAPWYKNFHLYHLNVDIWAGIITTVFAVLGTYIITIHSFEKERIIRGQEKKEILFDRYSKFLGKINNDLILCATEKNFTTLRDPGEKDLDLFIQHMGF